jgi:ketosteroid isomerase-like protein
LKLIALLILPVLYSAIFGQEKNKILGTLIATENAFAASAVDIGTHDAFLAYIADDGILFKPDPVNGKEFLFNSGSSDGTLKWYPSYADISKEGDLGFTTGPWEWTIKEKDTDKSFYGNYCTVWEKHSDGDWFFVIDFGNKNDKPVSPPPRLRSALNYSAIPLKNVVNDKEVPTELFELDKLLDSGSYIKYTGANSRILRDGSFPYIGSENISQYISGNEVCCCFKPIGGKFSLSKDFGFTYGKYENTNPKKNIKEQFNYLHVWKKEGNRWILLTDVASKSAK